MFYIAPISGIQEDCRSRQCKEYPELVEPAKLILNKCDGLPLAIVTIGSFLAKQETRGAEWRKLNAHITAELEINPKIGLIRAVLMKTYDGLPYYLKPCFLYMSHLS